jgi:hypothetical protein
MTEPELHSSICYQILKQVEGKFVDLQMRWLDESMYEDFNDYKKCFANLVAEAVNAHGFKSELKRKGNKLTARVFAPDGASCSLSGKVQDDFFMCRFTRSIPVTAVE